MGQPKKQSDRRGLPVHGQTNEQAIRANDQNVKHTNQPQLPEAEHPHQKPSGEK
ncbi:MAG: hypothetical protein JWM11_776 [Planctomycetaceae bacterium]|nr:hypothetical protein [Planctomycetaceae bacterium]